MNDAEFQSVRRTTHSSMDVPVVDAKRRLDIRSIGSGSGGYQGFKSAPSSFPNCLVETEPPYRGLR